VSFIVLLAGAAGILALVLLVPFGVSARGAFGEDEVWGVVELCWGSRLMRFRWGTEEETALELCGIRVRRFRAAHEKREATRGEEEDASRDWRRWVGRSRLQRVLRSDPRVAGRMLARGVRALHPRLRLEGRVGLDDPADTATVLAAVRVLREVLGGPIEVRLFDELLESRTQLFGRVGVRIIPAEVAIVLLGWFFRSETRRLLRGK